MRIGTSGFAAGVIGAACALASACAGPDPEHTVVGAGRTAQATGAEPGAAAGRPGVIKPGGRPARDTPGTTGLGNIDNPALGGATRGPGTNREATDDPTRPGTDDVRSGPLLGGRSVPGAPAAAGAGAGDAEGGAVGGDGGPR